MLEAMNRSELLRRLAAHKGEVHAFGVATLALFGSAARDEATAESDLDFLVEFDGPVTLERFMGLKHFLEKLLERRVDLVTSRAMKARMRRAIRSELLRVA